MQIREQGKKIQLIRTKYVKDKKRTVGEVFDSFDRYATTVPDSIRSQLNEEELKQLETYLSNREASKDLDRLKFNLTFSVRHIEGTTEALNNEELAASLTAEKAAELYQAMDDLKKALRKAGHVKVKSEPKQPAPDPRQASILDAE